MASLEATIHLSKKPDAKGIDVERAWKSASNGRGSWWNSRASHMNQAIPVKFLERLGLVSLLMLVRRFQGFA